MDLDKIKVFSYGKQPTVNEVEVHKKRGTFPLLICEKQVTQMMVHSLHTLINPTPSRSLRTP